MVIPKLKSLDSSVFEPTTFQLQFIFSASSLWSLSLITDDQRWTTKGSLANNPSQI